jgi:short-subunit dehydrogenase
VKKAIVMKVEEAAQQIFDAIKRKKRIAYVKKRWQLIAGILKLLPASLYNRM